MWRRACERGEGGKGEQSLISGTFASFCQCNCQNESVLISAQISPAKQVEAEAAKEKANKKKKKRKQQIKKKSQRHN